MDRLAIDIAEAVARLSALTIFELRNEWRRRHRMAPPMRLSRDLLIRAIAYKLQERAYGGLSKAVARKLQQTSTDPSRRGEAKTAQPISLKPGTRLVREWRGTTHMVLVHADGVEWRGQRYPSSSSVYVDIDVASAARKRLPICVVSGGHPLGLRGVGNREICVFRDRDIF